MTSQAGSRTHPAKPTRAAAPMHAVARTHAAAPTNAAPQPKASPAVPPARAHAWTLLPLAQARAHAWTALRRWLGRGRTHGRHCHWLRLGRTRRTRGRCHGSARCRGPRAARGLHLLGRAAHALYGLLLVQTASSHGRSMPGIFVRATAMPLQLLSLARHHHACTSECSRLVPQCQLVASRSALSLQGRSSGWDRASARPQPLSCLCALDSPRPGRDRSCRGRNSAIADARSTAR